MGQSEHWPNAPLVFVLAVIRISAYPNFEKRLDDVHEHLLGEFPERIDSSGLNIQLGALDPSVNQHKNVRIINSDSGVSVLLREDLIAIEWAEYIDFEKAAITIDSVLEAAFCNLPHVTVQHVGLRYVNALLESNKDMLEKFVHPGLLGSPLLGKLVSSTCGSAVELEESRRVSLTLHRSDKKSGEVFLPPGIEFPPNISPNRCFKLFIAHSGGFGLLDADGGAPIRTQKDGKSDVMAVFAKLRESMRPAFISAVTETAIIRWKESV